MLHEILLSLSGYHSDVFEKVKRPSDGDGGVHSFTSEPEKAMLEVLGHIAQLHVDIRETSARIASGHESVICRGVASAISNEQLANFRKKIIQIESSILQRDSGYVGGYGIVPLSTVVGEFNPWTRRLVWLSKVVQYTIEPDLSTTISKCSGKDMLDMLQSETHTGYSDIEEMATSLLCTGQKIWMRSVASWVLYGKLPAFGAGDFFIQPNVTRAGIHDEYIVKDSLLPRFVSTTTAQTVLVIGNAINQINAQRTMSKSSTMGDPMTLLPQHLRVLQTLQYPLNGPILQLALEEIDLSISQNALASLLPLEQVVGLLQVLHRFVLLGEGEFATTLIEHAADKVHSRQTAQATKPVRKAGRVDDLTIKGAELASVMTTVWDELAGLQIDEAVDDDTFNLARSILVLRSAKDTDQPAIPMSTLMPTSTRLDVSLSSDSNLRLFLHQDDVRSYAFINAYLLSVRRSELNLSQLWKLTSHRRCHPTPTGPPLRATSHGQQALQTRRHREHKRSIRMRQHWATASKALFVINELDAYLHSEVIRNSWSHFEGWLHEHPSQSRPGSSRSQPSRPGTATSAKTQPSGTSTRSRQMNDPRTLARAHHAFLGALYSDLLLNNNAFVGVLKELLNTVDHDVALFARLQTIWQGLDLQEDEGVVDAFSNYKTDEAAVLAEMGRSRVALEEHIGRLVEQLKHVDVQRDVSDLTGGVESIDIGHTTFVPWKVRTMDRLIMKLDYLAGAGGHKDGQEETGEDVEDE